MSSKPFINEFRRNGSISNFARSPSESVTTSLIRSTVTSYPVRCNAFPIIVSTVTWSSTTGTIPFCMQLLRKMSAKLGAMIARKPISFSAQGACSREEPEPKLRPATRIVAFS